MRNRLMVLIAAVLMVGAVAMVAGVNVSPVVAQGIDGGCMPIGIGWSCSCTSTVVPNVACIKTGSGEGQLVVTTCTSCPPPCRRPPCEIAKCVTTKSANCV